MTPTAFFLDNVQWEIWSGPRVSVQSASVPSTPSSGAGNPRCAMTLDLSADYAEESLNPEARRGDWGAFDTLVATCFAVQELVVGFMSAADMALFITDNLEHKMPHIRDHVAPKCVIAQYDPDADGDRHRTGYLLPDDDPAGAFKLCRAGVRLTRTALPPSHRAEDTRGILHALFEKLIYASRRVLRLAFRASTLLDRASCTEHPALHPLRRTGRLGSPDAFKHVLRRPRAWPTRIGRRESDWQGTASSIGGAYLQYSARRAGATRLVHQS